MCFHGPTSPQKKKKQAQQAHPVLKKNGTKNGISRLKTGYRKYGRTNVLPFSVPFPFMLSRFRLSRKNENGREKTVYGCERNGIHPVRFHPWMQGQVDDKRGQPPVAAGPDTHHDAGVDERVV
jgi:hypothetical protein